MKHCTLDERRGIAVGAARAQYRQWGIDPNTRTADNALDLLDDLARRSPDLIAAQWYVYAAEKQRQLKLFVRDWEARKRW
jgi:hypothetical protein